MMQGCRGLAAEKEDCAVQPHTKKWKIAHFIKQLDSRKMDLFFFFFVYFLGCLYFVFFFFFLYQRWRILHGSYRSKEAAAGRLVVDSRALWIDQPSSHHLLSVIRGASRRGVSAAGQGGSLVRVMVEGLERPGRPLSS